MWIGGTEVFGGKNRSAEEIQRPHEAHKPDEIQWSSLVFGGHEVFWLGAFEVSILLDRERMGEVWSNWAEQWGCQRVLDTSMSTASMRVSGKNHANDQKY